MKKIFLSGFYVMAVYVSGQSVGKVGINTNSPETELHVQGTMKTSGMGVKNTFDKLGARENYSFLIKSPATENKITSYNESFVPTAPAPINLIQFKITCHVNDKDWVTSYDTKINSDKFLVIISSFGFTQPVHVSGDSSLNWLGPIAQIYAYPENHTWKLKADYQGFKPSDSSTVPAGVWTLNLLVFDRIYSKEFNFTASLSNSSTGAATTPLIQ